MQVVVRSNTEEEIEVEKKDREQVQEEEKEDPKCETTESCVVLCFGLCKIMWGRMVGGVKYKYRAPHNHESVRHSSSSNSSRADDVRAAAGVLVTEACLQPDTSWEAANRRFPWPRDLGIKAFGDKSIWWASGPFCKED